MTTIKQFLKPDWRKIVIFVILLSSILLTIYFLGFYDRNAILKKISDNAFGKIECPACPLIGTCENYKCKYYLPDISTSIAYLIGFGIISYLLSCLIVWIYDKFRGRKK